LFFDLAAANGASLEASVDADVGNAKQKPMAPQRMRLKFFFIVKSNIVSYSRHKFFVKLKNIVDTSMTNVQK